MTLLKNDKSIKPMAIKPMAINRHSPTLTIADGWRFGIGHGLALVLAVPVILFVLGLLTWILIIVFGGLIGGLGLL